VISWIAPGGLYAWNRVMKPKTLDENFFYPPTERGAMGNLSGETRWARLESYAQIFRVAVIFVSAAETRTQAWRRHVREHPKDRNAEIKIFNFACQ
jgi:hypothetical protein